MIKVSDTCTGCGACVNICPKKAISMQENNEGFLYPVVDETKCIQCGLCDKACLLNHEKKTDNLTNPTCYAAAANDELRLNSSSGAIFPVLAEFILNNGGIVCGAALQDQSVKHIIISDLKELDKLKGSKYLQSEIGTVFADIKQTLNKGINVLFSGTPCQVAGLKFYLGKQYDNLITVDIICHGVPSPKVYRKYLSELESGTNEKFTKTNFRDKSCGWENFSITHTSRKTNYTKKFTDDLYFRAFLSNLSLRKSCGQCPAVGFARSGDLTLGDFWGIDAYDAQLNDHLGLSCVLLNSEKGKNIFYQIQDKLKICKKVPLSYAVQGNPCLIQASIVHPKRQEFFDNLDKTSLEKNLDYTLDNKFDCAILNFWYSNNYGAVLTCWALQEKIKEFGLKPKVIQWDPHSKSTEKGISYDFRKFLDLTEPCHTKEDLKKLNQLTKNFIAGSDQIWRYIYAAGEGKDVFWLNFADTLSNKISYAASFGSSEWEGPENDTNKIRYYMSRMNSISVREKDGVDLCENIFNVSATHVLDPVFLLNEEKYNKIIQEASMTDDKIIASYVLEDTPTIQNTIQMMQEKYPNHKYISMSDAQKQGHHFTVSDFLYTIKNCDFFVTDSFHGVCFALIFNKPFICFANIQRGFSRFKSLLDMVGLSNRCILTHLSKDMIAQLFSEIDYKAINKILSDEKEKSKNWLLNALQKRQISTEQNCNIKIDFLINYFENKIENVKQYPIYQRKYLKYKILKSITFGKLRKKFKKRKKMYHDKIQQIKNEDCI